MSLAFRVDHMLLKTIESVNEQDPRPKAAKYDQAKYKYAIIEMNAHFMTFDIFRIIDLYDGS